MHDGSFFVPNITYVWVEVKEKYLVIIPQILSYLEVQTCFGGKTRTILMLLTPYLQNLIIPTSTHLNTNLSYQPETVSTCKCLILLIIFSNSSDPDQAQQNVEPDLGLNCLTF